MSQEKKNLPSYLPIAFALTLGFGIYLGAKISGGGIAPKNFFSLPKKNFNKVNELINFIENEYVDDISKDELVNKTINSLLADLDPHSYYINADNLSAANEPLEGNFEGIGIEFNLQKDTVIVVSTIEGGPSELEGIISGDRIIRVNTENIAGVNLPNEEIVKRLKGKKGTLVNVSILRGSKILEFSIRRGKIPINSVDIGYMVAPEIGYIKVSRFAKNTHQEFLDNAFKLKNKGMTSLILDLRGNGGGYLDAAIKLADEFLGQGQLIVYTEGKARPKSSYYASKQGNFDNINLYILVDEGSASASEILAGALQDNDKGLIIGRRTFGKGLVQEQVVWPDGSAIRLTIARYYTPTGRCIQKPYEKGSEDYFTETYNRFEKGELIEKDSIHFKDSLKFYTSKGKVVYGGGGIMPDVFLPLDTSETSLFLAEITQLGLITQFAFNYTDQNREKMLKFKDFDSFNKSFLVSDQLLNDFIEFSAKNNVKTDIISLKKSNNTLKIRIKAYIAKQLFKNEGFYKVIHQLDHAFQKTLSLALEGK